jgi:hypothetical protein
MSISSFVQLPLVTAYSNYAFQYFVGFLTEDSTNEYLPITITQFSIPTFTIPNVPLVLSATTLTGVSGAFDNVRVGDIIQSVSTGAITAKSLVARTGFFLPSGSKFVVYPESYNSSTLGVKAGDAVTVTASGTGIPVNSVVTRIDHASRTIYINNAITGASKIADLDFTPPTRVTAVRTSTATLNPNQIDFDSAVGTANASSTLTILPGAREAVFAALRLTPVSNSSAGQLNVNVAFATLPGSGVVGSANGLNNIDPTVLSYSTVGTIPVQLSKFLLDARVPAPTTP